MFSLFLLISLRNLIRNQRRSLTILLLLTLSVSVFLIYQGYLNYTFEGMKLGYRLGFGDFQISKKGFALEVEDRAYLTEVEMTELVDFLNDLPEVDSINQVIMATGLIGNDKKSTIFTGSFVKEKTGVGSTSFPMTAGRGLYNDEAGGIVIGREMSDILNVTVGSPLNILTTDSYGAMTARTVEVVGIMKVPSAEWGKLFIDANYQEFQTILDMPGGHKALVSLLEDERAQTFAEKFDRWNKDELYEIVDWKMLNPFYDELKDFYGRITFFISIVFSVLVFVAIREIFSMSFYERFREMATIRSLGTTTSEVFLMMIIEAVILALVGFFLGVVLSLTFEGLLRQLNLEYAPPGSTIAYPVGIQIDFFIHSTLPFLCVFISSLLGAILPAYKISRKNIIGVFHFD